jgi:4'-phosphopantetheinyl transferase
MPIIKEEQIRREISWCIWKIEESVDALMQTTHLSDRELQEFRRYRHMKRKKEWLGARNAIGSLLRLKGYDYSGIEKDEYEKPLLRKGSLHISLAHSYPFAVAMVHENQPCGIDIEKTKPTLLQVSHRFLCDQELSSINQNLDGLCIAWAAKESLYKMYGKIPLSFKNQMFLYPFQIKHEGEVQAEVTIGGQREKHFLSYRRIDDFYVCLSC